MKKSLVALAALSIASLAFAHGGSGTVNPTAASISSSGASGYVSGTGVSIQGAANQGTAAVNGAAVGTGVGIGPLKTAGAVVEGVAKTTNVSVAGGVTVGPTATGTHDAAGKSTASIVGSAEGHTVTNGPLANANGNVETVTATQVGGSGTGAGYAGAQMDGSFKATADASQIKIGNLNQITTNSSAIGGVIGSKIEGSIGNTTTGINNQGAFNSFGQSRVGAQISN